MGIAGVPFMNSTTSLPLTSFSMNFSMLMFISCRGPPRGQVPLSNNVAHRVKAQAALLDEFSCRLKQEPSLLRPAGMAGTAIARACSLPPISALSAS